MKNKFLILGLILSSTLFYNGCARQKDFPDLRGPYLGQRPPGMVPEVFAPGIVSTGMPEASISFSPGGDEVYYNIIHWTHGFTAIIFMKQKRRKWTRPQVASFSGKHNDSDVCFSHDGKRLYFTSDRPLNSEEKAGNLDIWVVERNESGWREPENLGPPINSEVVDVNPCITRNGTLYFASDRPGGRGEHDIYRSQLIDGIYSEPENLGDSINSTNFESSPYVAPDESYIIFNVFVGPNSGTRSGLHITFRREDGTWTKAVNMGDSINDKRPARFAFVTYDGRYLFFTHDKVPYLPYTGEPLTYDGITQMLNGPQNGAADIYWVDARIIEELKLESFSASIQEKPIKKNEI